MTGESRKFWKKVFEEDKFCIRCGGGKRNSSELCYKCNKDFWKFMKDHPLDDCEDLSEMMKASKNRWEDFVSKVQT